MTTQDVANAKRDTRSKKRFAFPYGEIWVDEHKSQTDLPFKFTGKELDPETGLYYYGARYYDARLSRWISADPALEKYMPKATDFDTEHDFYWYVQNDASGKLPGMGGVFNSLNLDMYAYAGMNPVKLVDPDGRSTGDVMIDIETLTNNATPISQSLKHSPAGQAIGAIKDFVTQYQTMRKENIKFNDHYNHAMANSKAALRGETGKKTARFLSFIREAMDHYGCKNDTLRDVREDNVANRHGRNIKPGESPEEHNKRFDYRRGGSRATVPSASNKKGRVSPSIFFKNYLIRDKR